MNKSTQTEDGKVVTLAGEPDFPSPARRAGQTEFPISRPASSDSQSVDEEPQSIGTLALRIIGKFKHPKIHVLKGGRHHKEQTMPAQGLSREEGDPDVKSPREHPTPRHENSAPT